jgi:hypothetical protein
MDSSRPSIDTGGGNSPRPESPARPNVAAPTPAAQDLAQPVKRQSFGREDSNESFRGSRNNLPTVAERKSEYGFDNILASYGLDDPAPPALPTEVVKPPDKSKENAFSLPKTEQAAEAAFSKEPTVSAAVPEPKSPEKEIKRFSTSPKLPDVARMSSFGPDLFANPSDFLSDAPPMPNLPSVPDKATERSAEIKTPTVSAKDSYAAPKEPISFAVMQPTEQAAPEPQGPQSRLDPPHSIAEPSQVLQTSTSSDENQDRGIISPDMSKSDANMDKSRATQPVTNEAAEQGSAIVGEMTSMDDPRSTKGTHMSETPAVPETTVSKAVPLSGLAATAAVEMSKPAANAAAPEKSPANESNNAPQQLPKLLTSKFAQAASKSAAKSAETAPVQPAEATKDTMAKGAQASSATPKLGARDITPTAPLRPRKSDQHVPQVSVAQDSASPAENLERSSTFDSTIGHSTPKDSDKLSEEIIKTLSPVRASDDFVILRAPENDSPLVSGATPRERSHEAAREVPRESTYLPDVYGDYWDNNDEEDAETKPVTQVRKVEETSKAKAPEANWETHDSPAEEKASAPAVKLEDDAGSAAKSAAAAAIEDMGASPLRRKFSWEAGPEPEDKSPSSIKQPPAASATISPAGQSEAPVSGLSTPSLPQTRENPALESPVSPQIAAPSQPLQAQTGIGDKPTIIAVPTEPTSPEKGRRVSLAEEKGLVQTSSQPVSPTPPPERHPALQTSSEASPRTATPTSPNHRTFPAALPFRQIMEKETSAERLRLYQDARSQYARFDTGLDDWLTAMHGAHPEHTDPMAAFRAPPGQQSTSQISPTGLQAGSQQMPPPQQRTSSQAGPSISGGSSGQYSSGQMGAKSKDFLFAAGKASKGFLSKGKHKFKEKVVMY